MRFEPPIDSAEIRIAAKVVYMASNGHRYVNAETKVLHRQVCILYIAVFIRFSYTTSCVSIYSIKIISAEFRISFNCIFSM